MTSFNILIIVAYPILTFLICQNNWAIAFAPLPATIHLTKRHVQSTDSPVSKLHLSNIGPKDEAYMADDAFDVEGARKRLESLVASSGDNFYSIVDDQRNERNIYSINERMTISSSISNLFPGIDVNTLDTIEIPAPPLMTTIHRVRVEAEIKLIQKLEHGDEALPDIWDLWFNERGPDAAAKLHKADELTQHGKDGLEQAETILTELIKEYGPNFVEPLNRLATLYYIHGYLKESQTLWMLVVSAKPWHFGALSGLVKVFADLNNSENALLWASKRLPAFVPHGPNKRRAHWVEKSLSQLNKRLLQADQILQKSFFRQEDLHAIDAALRHSWQ